MPPHPQESRARVGTRIGELIRTVHAGRVRRVKAAAAAGRRRRPRPIWLACRTRCCDRDCRGRLRGDLLRASHQHFRGPTHDGFIPRIHGHTDPRSKPLVQLPAVQRLRRPLERKFQEKVNKGFLVNGAPCFREVRAALAPLGGRSNFFTKSRFQGSRPLPGGRPLAAQPTAESTFPVVTLARSTSSRAGSDDHAQRESTPTERTRSCPVRFTYTASSLPSPRRSTERSSNRTPWPAGSLRLGSCAPFTN